MHGALAGALLPLLAVFVLGCSGSPATPSARDGPESPAAPVTPAATSATPLPEQASIFALGASRPAGEPFASCPVTTPNGRAPAGLAQPDRFHGNDSLGAYLTAGSTLRIGPGGTGRILPDGSLAHTLYFWAGDVDVPVTIEAHRVDAEAPVVTAELAWVSEREQGARGIDVVLPSEGCWEVEARAGEAALTVVMRFVRLPVHPDLPALIALGEQVRDHVAAYFDDAVLRQIDVAVPAGSIIFRFVSERADCARQRCEVALFVPSLKSDRERWRGAPPRASALSQEAGPALQPDPLTTIGPAAVLESMTAHAPDCAVDTISLRQGSLQSIEPGAERPVFWTASCTDPDGLPRNYSVGERSVYRAAVDPPVGGCLVHGC